MITIDGSQHSGSGTIVRYSVALAALLHIPLDAGGAVSRQRAVLHGAAGELDAAFRPLDRALDLHDPGLGYL